MRSGSIPLLGCGLAAFLIGCGGGGTPIDGCEEVLAADAWIDGEPPGFVELWRAGGTNEGEELAQPLFAAVGPEGQLAIIDARLGPIGVGPDGGWLGPLAPSGQGPGEVTAAFAAAWDDDGRLSLLDMGNGRIVRPEPEVSTSGVGGEPRADLPIGQDAMVALAGGVTGLGLGPDGTVHAVTVAPRPATSEVAQTLVRLRSGGGMDTLASAVTPSLVTDWLPAQRVVAPGAPRLLFATGADGRLAVAGENASYRIRVVGSDGEEFEICRAVAGHELRSDERGEGLDESNPFGQYVLDTPAPVEPFPIGRLLFAREGRLWVERDRPRPHPTEWLQGRPGSRYDVFEPDGRYLGELRAPERAQIMAISGNRVWAFETGELDETWVVAYRLERSP